MLLAFPTVCVTTACRCLHVFSCLSVTLTPSSFLEAMAKPKCLHTLDPKVEHQQFHKRCHHLQHPPLLLYCQICISEPRADGNSSSHFALLCFTVAENSTLFAQKTYHLTFSYVHADITAMPQELTITSQCKAVFVLNSCSCLMQCLTLCSLSL